MISLAIRTFYRLGSSLGLANRSKEIASPVSRIGVLLLVKLSLTVTMELIWRELLAGFTDNPSLNRFFVHLESGEIAINRQSVINICMTGTATLLGSWVMFGSQWQQRFLLFVSSGLLIALVSQVLVYSVSNESLSYDPSRMKFDALYTFFVKWPVFEWGRISLIRRRTTVLGLFGVRIAQDSAMSAFRISVLNYFHIH